jgi:RNA polymerase sigma-70 factor (ECF subfamily)
VTAFERIYGKFHRRIYGVCLKMTGDRSMAEELTQDTFVRVWQKLHLYETHRSLGAWLYRIAVNVVLSDRRSQRRLARVIDSRVELPEKDEPQASVAPEAGLDLETAMDRLPPRARAVFVLHDIEGHRHEEIARLTGVAVGTSKAQLHRARRILREALRT